MNKTAGTIQQTTHSPLNFFLLQELERIVLQNGSAFIATTHAQLLCGHWEYCCTT